MSLNIEWTNRAKNSFEKIYKYINESFGENTARKFVKESFEVFELLASHPKMGTVEDSYKGIFGFVLSEQTTLFYRITSKDLILINLFNNRMNPKSRSNYYK